MNPGAVPGSTVVSAVRVSFFLCLLCFYYYLFRQPKIFGNFECFPHQTHIRTRRAIAQIIPLGRSQLV